MNKYRAAVDVGLARVSDIKVRRAFADAFERTQQEVDAGQITTVIIAARRMASIYVLLVEAGMPELTGCLVVTDRFYDADPQHDWDDEKILILDDSVVLGTTLFELSEGLAAEMGGPGSIRLRAVCLEKESFALRLFADLDFEYFQTRTSAQMNTLSKELVQALFTRLIPFFSDYPTTLQFKFKKTAWTRLLATEHWSVADVTAPFPDLTRSNGQQQKQLPATGDNSSYATYSFVPTAKTTQRILTRLPAAAAELTDAVKIRVFTQRRADGSYNVVVVPLALLAPSTPDALTKALTEISRTFRPARGFEKIPWETWKPVALQRLVQLYVSACVLAEFWPLFTDSQRTPPPLSHRDLKALPVNLYFGDSSDQVLAAFDEVVRSYQALKRARHSMPIQERLDSAPPASLLLEHDIEDTLWAGRELLAKNIPPEPSPGEFTKIGLVLSHAICGIFGFINREYEMDQRSEIAQLADPKAFRAWRKKSHRVLKRSLTLRELSLALLPQEMLATSVWRRAVVSLGIDVGNDLGIIVPITVYDEEWDVVYRCYRLGESAFLARFPLTEAVLQPDPQLDDLARTVETGYPVLSFKRSSQETNPCPEHTGTKLLVETVRKRVPGKLDRHFEGVVTSVEADRFFAEVATPTGSEQAAAEIPFKVIPLTDLPRVQPGATFTWSTFLPTFGDGVTRFRFAEPVKLRVPKRTKSRQ